MLNIRKIETVARVHTHTHTHTQVILEDLTHIFSWLKIRSPNVDVGADDSVCL